MTGAVEITRVKEIDAIIQGSMNGRYAFLPALSSIEHGHSHTSEAKPRNVQPIALIL
jgi:hypothetical protein